jgi:group I intron endonuclease
MHYLYKITNTINSKVYIGQSNKDQYRWRQHCYFAKHPEKTGQYIHRAMNKYGVDSFTFEIIATCQTREDADETEAVLITQYDTRNHEFGYNLKAGGRSSAHSESTKQKLREATLRQIEELGHPSQGRIRSEEACNNISQGKIKNPTVYTDEMRQKFSEVFTGRIQSEETVGKRIQSIAETTKQRHEKEIAEGKRKCHAPDCDVVGGGRDYLRYQGELYCMKHGQRLKRNGTLETLPPHRTIGQAPSNKHVFTDEQIKQIMTDPRGAGKVGKDFGVTEKVILRIRRENAK